MIYGKACIYFVVESHLLRGLRSMALSCIVEVWGGAVSIEVQLRCRFYGNIWDFEMLISS